MAAAAAAVAAEREAKRQRHGSNETWPSLDRSTMMQFISNRRRLEGSSHHTATTTAAAAATNPGGSSLNFGGTAAFPRNNFISNNSFRMMSPFNSITATMNPQAAAKIQTRKRSSSQAELAQAGGVSSSCLSCDSGSTSKT